MQTILQSPYLTVKGVYFVFFLGVSVAYPRSKHTAVTIYMGLSSLAIAFCSIIG